jgi:hypothetical protein
MVWTIFSNAVAHGQGTVMFFIQVIGYKYNHAFGHYLANKYSPPSTPYHQNGARKIAG